MTTYPENQDQWPTDGSWKAIHGKLAPDDARAAYVVGTQNGHTGPWASFWNYSEAVRYAKKAEFQTRNQDATD